MAGYDRLTPQGKRFYAEVSKFTEQEAFIGFQRGKESEDDGTDMVDIAAFNELGTSSIPARPFLRKSVDENGEQIEAMMAQMKSDLAAGKSAEECLKKLGVFGKSLVQEKIESGEFVPNAPSTIRKKGSDKPLIDTGRMRQSVQYVIRRKGEGE